ncbi:ABCA5 transporter, putative [Ixodes scapularis]|uniref:ABCA5 transporter, putative n=1 Tax=Ixodes scapularis TaxID=6945 RepID=B7PQ73_IXOSC|nr:ABCA5 transporter, putative [Ixodes scapularis]|eukprot:XP_002435915.1 ABCA5 transporter, putative [Ixodes scapularis]
MGLSDLAYWMGLFSASMLFLIVDSIIAIGCLTILKDTQTGTHSYFENVNLLLLAVVFLVFCCMQTLHAMLISVLFKSGAMTALFGLIYWLVLTFVGPVFYIEGFTGGLASYILARPWKKLATSMTPCIGTYWMLKILSLFQDYDGYAGWGMVNEYALDLDNVTIMQIVCVMGATFLALVCLIWYLSRVLPWVASAPRPFYFPLLPSYWIPSLVAPMDSEEEGPGGEDGVFEPLSKGMKIVMSARDLSKVFGRAVALNRINLNIYEGQITVLLGHNGSGKTTLMNIFAGLTSPSGGVARICGYDVTKSTAQARQSMGYCQQSNVFFDDLTVREHLIYFGTLKGVGSSELGAMTDKILQEVKLTNKADSFPEVLSGGMKRKLGVAIALVAKPKVLFLDEPSSGMDAQNRRTMWNLLLELRSRCTLLLSTHDMEEADALADRILVLAKGALVCSGSPPFLMREYGAGYQVRITKRSAGFDLLQIQRIIVATAPEAELVEERAGDVLIRLNVVHFTGFDVMFRALEEKKDQLGIETIGVTLSTIEDVYIKIHFAAASQTGPNSDIYDDAKVVGKTRHHKPVSSACLKALFFKRAIHFSRSWDLCLVSCIMPCLAILAIFVVEDLLLPQPPSEVPGEKTLPVTLDAIKPSGARVFVLQETGRDQELADMFVRLTVTGGHATVRNFTYARRGLFMEAAMDFWGYTHTYILGAAFTRDGVELWYSAYTNGSQAVAMNLLTTALLRLRTGNPTADLSATVVVHEQSVDTDRHDVDLASEMIRKSVVFRSFSFPVVTSLIVAGFVLFPVAERTCQAKTLQLMTGMSGSAYWVSNLMFDLVVYWVIWIFAAMVVVQYVELFIDSIRNRGD